MRVVIAEDLTLLREGLSRLLDDRGWEIVAAVDDGPKLVEAIAEHRPDIAIVDVRLPPSFTDEGIRAAIEARRRVPGTPILILSQYVEESYAADLLAGEGGGVGYLLKDRVPTCAVRRVARARGGRRDRDGPRGGGAAARPPRQPRAAVRADPARARGAGLMAEGRSNTGIGVELGISSSAIEKHVKQVFTKLDLPPSDEDHRRVLAVLAYLRS